MPNLPGSATTKRVRVWRRLQSVGAVAVRPSVYVLPARDDCVETLQWVAREIIEMGGQAALCEGQFFDGVTDLEVERKLVDARSADYTALGKELRELIKALKAKRLEPEKLAGLEAQLSKLRHRLAEIVGIDFCNAPGREGAEGLVASAELAVAAAHGARPEPEHWKRTARPRAATWVTRAGVHVDRIACAWLIGHFIDRGANFKFVAPEGYVPEPGELRFDMYEAEFTHVGDRCSFEVLLSRFGIEDGALSAIAEIVHDIDVRDEKYGRPETNGVKSQIAGICATIRDDLGRIAAATPMFEALHAFFATSARSSKARRRK